MALPVSQHLWVAGGLPGVGAEEVTAILVGGGVGWLGPDDTVLWSKRKYTIINLFNFALLNMRAQKLEVPNLHTKFSWSGYLNWKWNPQCVFNYFFQDKYELQSNLTIH